MKKVVKEEIFTDDLIDDWNMGDLFIESKIPLGTKVRITLEPIIGGN